jgi:hypothetical protein
MAESVQNWIRFTTLYNGGLVRAVVVTHTPFLLRVKDVITLDDAQGKVPMRVARVVYDVLKNRADVQLETVIEFCDKTREEAEKWLKRRGAQVTEWRETSGVHAEGQPAAKA